MKERSNKPRAMKRFLSFPISCMPVLISLHAQTLVITFQAELNADPVSLDSVLVMNLDQGGDTTLYAPDTMLVLGATGMDQYPNVQGTIIALPNPFQSRTEVLLTTSGIGDRFIYVHDLTGREVAALQLPGGHLQHRLAFSSAGAGVYFLSAIQGRSRWTTRVVALEAGSGYSLENVGLVERTDLEKGGGAFNWTQGEALRYIGYGSDGLGILSGYIDAVPSMSTTETLQFNRGIVCSGSPSVSDIDGNSYLAIQIGSQCWMAENLRTAHYRDANPITHVTDNMTWIQQSSGAWCNYNNEALMDAVYGKLYNWYAIANSSGLCPLGWHVPTDEEWQQLELELGLPAGEVDDTGWRGNAQNVGGKMKADAMWASPSVGATNESGFSGVPSGARSSVNGSFNLEFLNGFWWSATSSSSGAARYRSLRNQYGDIRRSSAIMELGAAVRCVKD